MALSKIKSESISTNAVGPTQLNEGANYDFTGTVTGVGGGTIVVQADNNGSQQLSDSTTTKINVGTELGLRLFVLQSKQFQNFYL